MSRLVYLAGPIDHVSRPEAVLWRVSARECFENHGFATYDPTQPFGAAFQSPREVWEVNLEAIKRSCLVFVNLTKNVRSLGTGREVEFAKAHDVSVFAWIAEGAPSLALEDLAVTAAPNIQAAVDNAVIYSSNPWWSKFERRRSYEYPQRPAPVTVTLPEESS